MRATPARLRPLTGFACVAVTLLAACGGGGGGGGGAGSGSSGGNDGAADACTEAERKQFTLDVARQWYLFPELLPANVDPRQFEDAEQLLDHLTATAREQGKDRYFSYLTTRSGEQALLGDGQFVGFGFRTRTDAGSRVFVTEVFESSPAAEAGLRRGDEILAVDAGSGFVATTDLLTDGRTISEALGPAEAGIRRGLRLLGSGGIREVSLAKRSVTMDPVPDDYGIQILPLAGTAGVGYLNLRSYVGSADPQLRQAFNQFRARGLDYFIVDLRYNGGGLVSTAELLSDLLGGARARNDVQFALVHNADRSSQNRTRFFDSRPESVRPVRIAFLTTGATGSASEISINTMAPWVEVAIVGGNTLGKPVGQLAFDLPKCEDRLRIVTFRTINALAQGDYYDGLAGTLRYACAATDTLDRRPGDATEGLTAAALEWLGTGACTSLVNQTPARSKPSGEPPNSRPGLPGQPSPAQLWMPGVE
jgi:C-terminal processing protease CtpA/Prc